MATHLTTQEAADRLRCHEKTVRRMIQRGDIDAVFVAGKYLILPDDLPLALPPRPASVPPIRPPKPLGRFAQMVDEDAAA